MNANLPQEMTFNWRKPDEPNGPVHTLVVTNLRLEGWGILGGRGRTLCGYEPTQKISVVATQDDVTCEPCLTALGGGAVDLAERLLRDVREPVAS